MRIDPNYALRLTTAIDRTGAAEQTLTSELSSGLRVSSLSTDPVAAAANVHLTGSISRIDTFVQTSSREQSMLRVTDEALGQVVAQVTSAIGIAVTASGGAVSAANYASIQKQVENIRDNIIGLANTSYLGSYVFSGSQSTTRPFVLDRTTDPATASYQGDALTQGVETPDGQKVQVNVAGSGIFQASSGDLLGTLNKLVSDLAAGASGTGSNAALQADSSALTAALASVTSQRSLLGSSLSRMTVASGYASTQETVLKAQQSALLSADPVSVATDLKMAEVQHQALLSIASVLDGQQSLFAYLK